MSVGTRMHISSIKQDKFMHNSFPSLIFRWACIHTFEIYVYILLHPQITHMHIHNIVYSNNIHIHTHTHTHTKTGAETFSDQQSIG